MTLLHIYNSNWLLITTLVIATGALLLTFGKQMMQGTAERTLAQPEQMSTSVTSREVKHYFVSKGYTVCNVTPISNSRKWFAILIKNKEYITATVFANGSEIERFEEAIM